MTKGILRAVKLALPAIVLVCLWYGCKKDQEDIKLTGSIYGTVTDYDTGQPVANANVSLRPGGETTLTGNDGAYEFSDLEDGNYSIIVSKSEYSELIDDYVITVKDGKSVRRDVQIERLPSELNIIDGNGADLDTLDFGADASVTSRTFSIFNKSPKKITWWIIVENCPWISEVKSVLSNDDHGQIESGLQEPIKVTIDRNRLDDRLNSYILCINSDNGSKELTILAGENVWKPSLTTQNVSNTTQSSATFNGKIDDTGFPSYHERGFVYSTTPQPTVDNSEKITCAVNNQPTFSASVSGLSSNSTYYVRAYAKNTVGVAYGNDISFTTGGIETQVVTSAATDIHATNAKLNATITVEGNPPYSEKGFCYNKNGNPTTNNNKIAVNGSGIGEYSAVAYNLEYNTTYHVRAYYIQNGTAKYGNEVTFSTSWTSTAVQTSAVSNIAATSATFNGAITEVGEPAYTERGFYYSSYHEPTSSDTKIAISGSGVGNFSHNITGLGLNTTYYVKAYAIQNGQIILGNAVSFTTAWTEAQVQTSAVSNIATTSARLNGNVTVAGTPAYTERGFCYSNSTSQPTINNNKIVANGSGTTGSYYKDISGLVEGTTYYVRAYVIQNGDVEYGTTVSFSTNASPIIYTIDVSNLSPVTSNGIILSWNVTFNGYIESVGSPAYVERGFCYGTSYNPTGNRQVVSGSGTGSFSKTITGLSNYQTYYVRAYVKTSSGAYVYGQCVSFSTYD